MTSKKIFALFPGQGSQRVGMGADIDHPLAREYFSRAQKVLGFDLGALCANGPQEQLTRTEIAQPAILTVSIISFSIAQELFPEMQIVCAAGHSLGEYSAHVASGAISFEDAVLLVHKRGRYMQEAVPAGVGKMVAILGKETEELEVALKKVTSGVASIANSNAPGQIVVAGDVQGVDEFLAHLGPVKAKELDVSAPFHCALMQPAADNLKKDLATLKIASPRFPVIANVTAEESSVQTIRELLEKQVCGRVRWVECIAQGVEVFSPDCAVEFGAGNVLTGLLKRIKPDLARENVYGVSDVEKLR